MFLKNCWYVAAWDHELIDESMFSPAGSGSEKGKREGSREYRNCQFMTSETRRTTHFFWTCLNNFEGENHHVSRSLHQSLIEGFMEDKHLIEAQQKVLDADPEFTMVAVVADAALSHFRRTFEKLVAPSSRRKRRPRRPCRWRSSSRRSRSPRTPEESPLPGAASHF
ncbi:hypothetical protein [Ramlibacter rhizophilus]|uniref:Vanillate O-demethylase oxygenase-like C-terminal catalytic domain-containing protein n=1 Tax=Ramlibacter rhizophilus TaxID=1781167 RepID=A0A4Z0BKA9_9BURK|nr:hypothetical protein [Ramlibacter rhizophilus]TFY99746.1 hypothetical protein EZ242_11425 [Ramlibacter rhizophilus]